MEGQGIATTNMGYKIISPIIKRSDRVLLIICSNKELGFKKYFLKPTWAFFVVLKAGAL